MDSKILITGSGGFLGKNLYGILSRKALVKGVGRSPGSCVDKIADLSDRTQCLEVLGEVKPSVIIHCAAFSNVDAAEAGKEEAMKSNVASVDNLAAWAKLNQARFIFISSDYVYDGKKGNFNEEDSINPLQYYGQTKAIGEEIVSSLPNFVILRPTVIYGWDEGGKNFFMQLYRNMRGHKPMVVPTDQISNPTSVVDLSLLISLAVDRPAVSGIFVSTGPEPMSRYDFACRTCEYFSWDKSLLVPKTTAEIGRLAPAH